MACFVHSYDTLTVLRVFEASTNPVVFKSFSRTSHLARNLFSSTGTYHNPNNTSAQPGFFVSTSTLHRQNSQLVSYGHASAFNSHGHGYNPHDTHTSGINGFPAPACLTAVTTSGSVSVLTDEESVGDGYGAFRRQTTSSKPKPVVYRKIAIGPVAPPTIETKRPQQLIHKRNFTSQVDSTDYSSLYESLKALQVSETVEQSVTPPSSPRLGPMTHNQPENLSDLEIPDLVADSMSESEAESISLTPPHPPLRRNAHVEFLPPIGISSVDECAILETPPGSPVLKKQSLAPSMSLQEALSSGDPEVIYDAYRQDRGLGLEEYNLVLDQLSMSTKQSREVPEIEMSVERLLSVYQDLLNTGIKPTTETYTSVIMALTTQSMKLNKWLKSPEYSQSHGTLSSVSDTAQRVQTLTHELAVLSLDLFFSSNSAHLQKYSTGVYETLLKSCSGQVGSSQLIQVLHIMETNGMQPTVSCYMSLMDHFTAAQDLQSVLAVYASFRNSPIAQSVSDSTLTKLYSKFVVALYACGSQETAEEFCGSVNGDDAVLSALYSATIEGLSATNKVRPAWLMVQQFELDNKASVSFESVCKLLSAVCRNKDAALARDIYTYCASNRAYANKPASASFYQNASRSDYIDLMIETRDLEALSQVAEELYVTATALDASTLARFCVFFLSQGHVKFALRFLSSQLEVAAFSEQVTNEIVVKTYGMVKQSTRLDAQELASFVSAFSHVAVGQNEFPALVSLLHSVWSLESPISMLLSKSAAPLQCLEQFATLHMVWIKTASKTTNVAAVDELKVRFGAIVEALMSQSCLFSEVFVRDIETTLKVMGMDTGVFEKRQEELRAKVAAAEVAAADAAAAEASKAEAAATLTIDTSLSRKVLAYVRCKAPSIPTALRLLGDAATSTPVKIASSEAFVAIIEACTSKDAFRGAYAAAMDTIPHPSTSAAAWQMWEPIHRAVIVSGAAIDPHAVSQAYQSLLAMGSHPCAAGYGHLILNRVPVPSTSHDEAHDSVTLFEEAVSFTEPTTFLFNVVLSKLSKARRFDSAMNVFSLMDKYNTKKTSVTFGTMISACCRAGNVVDAEVLFEQMESDPSYVPRAAPYNTMNQYYIHTARDAAAATRVFARMNAKGVTPTAHTFKLLIDLHTCDFGKPIDIAKADAVLLMIESCGQTVTEHHLASLLYARGVIMNDLEAAKAFYKNICTSRTVRPGTAIFQALIESYVANKKCHETDEVLQQMSQYGVCLTAYMTNSLIRGWAAQDFSKALALFDSAYRNGKAEPSSYEAIIRACIYNGELQCAYNILHMMKDASYPGPVVAKVENLLARVDQVEGGWSYLMHNTFKSETVRL